MTEPRARGWTESSDVLEDIRRWAVYMQERALVRQPVILPRSLLGYYAKHVIMDEAAAMGIVAEIEDPPPVFYEGGACFRGGAPSQEQGRVPSMINYAHHLGAPGALGLPQFVPAGLSWESGYAAELVEAPGASAVRRLCSEWAASSGAHRSGPPEDVHALRRVVRHG